jgi:hypothetical protein
MVIGCSNKIETGSLYSGNKFIRGIKHRVTGIFFILTSGDCFEVTQSKISILQIFTYISKYRDEIETILGSLRILELRGMAHKVADCSYSNGME